MASFTIAAIMCISCEREILPDSGDVEADGTVVCLAMGGDKTMTKSGIFGAVEETGIIADLSETFGVNGVILTETVSDMEGIVPATKGTPVYTQNLSEVYPGDIVPLAVYETTTKKERSDLKASFSWKEGTTWTHSYHESDWGDKKLTYYMAVPSAPAYIGTPSIDQDKRSITFSLVSANYPTTAVDQQDLLFTSKDITIVPGGTATADLLLYHVFTGVKFKVGNTDNRFRIVGVDLSNMYTSGTCTVTPNYPEDVTGSNAGGAEATKSSSCSVWKDKGGRKTFSQTYAGTVDYTSDNSNFADSFYNGKTDEKNLIATAGDTKATATFMCVPMAFSKDDADRVILTIHYFDDNDTSGIEKTATVDLSTSLDGKEWKPGQLYTYALTVNGLTVSVEDVTENGTMSEVVITNTGNMDGYIRATITANWVKEMVFSDGVKRNAIVAPWSRNGELPSFVKLSNDSWIKDGDCFYYYKNPVQGTFATNVPLFESYTIHDIPEENNGAPIPGCFLELTVSAQIVPAYTSKSGDAVKAAVVSAWAPSDAVVSNLATVAETPISK